MMMMMMMMMMMIMSLLVLVTTVPVQANYSIIETLRSTKNIDFKTFVGSEHANYILNLNHIFDNPNDINDSDTDKPDTPLSFHNLIQANTQTLHTLKHPNSNLLQFLEALYIKYRKLVLNNGLRASKELVVFF